MSIGGIDPDTPDGLPAENETAENIENTENDKP